MELKRFLSLLLAVCFLLLTAAFIDPVNPPEAEKFVVVLDAGHGGHDPGNLGNGYLEKNIALSIVLEAGKHLSKHQDIEVVYTRKEDVFVDLYVRGEIANKAKADLFVSVHCDSHNSDANGAGTFVLGLHANKQNFEIAKKENSVIYLEDNYETRYAAYDINSPQSIIGLTIMQEEFLEQSILLAKMMQDNFTGNLKRNNRKVKQAGFIVLHQTFMPSVLVETGFLTNKSEGYYLNSSKGQSEMGKAIADAIVTYKDNLWNGSGQYEEVTESVVTPVPVPVKQDEVSEDKAQQIAEKETKPVVDNEVAEASAAVATDPNVAKELKTPQQVQEETAAAVAAIGTAEALKTTKTEAEDKKEVETTTIGEVKPEMEKTVVKKEKVEQPKEKSPPVTKQQVTTEPAKAVSKEEKPVPHGITFKVQILASSKDIPLENKNFNGLNALSKEPFKNLYRYMYGKTESYEQAKLLKKNADQKGYTTSYIVAYKEGERITVKEALKYISKQ